MRSPKNPPKRRSFRPRCRQDSWGGRAREACISVRRQFAFESAAEGFDERPEILHSAVDGNHAASVPVIDEVHAFGSSCRIWASLSAMRNPMTRLDRRIHQLFGYVFDPAHNIVPAINAEPDLGGIFACLLRVDLPLEHRKRPVII